MRRFLRSIAALPRDVGRNADVMAEVAVDDDRLVHESFGLTAAVVAAVEKLAPS